MKLKMLVAALLTASINAHAVNMAYVEVNSNRFANVGCYVDSVSHEPFFKMASIFAANINGSVPDKPVIYLNPQVTATLNSGQVAELHKKGIKVLVTLLGNHQNAGWACMTSEASARKFADDVVAFVNKYHLDGIDIDDEYSRCRTNNTSMIMMAKAIKEHPGFSGKLLTKALFSDYAYFSSSYQGHTLSEYLDYGWEMSYFLGDLIGRLQPYMQAGMPASRLMIGGWTSSGYPDPYEIGQTTTRNELAGMMAYDVKGNSLAYLQSLRKGEANGHADVNLISGCIK